MTTEHDHYPKIILSATDPDLPEDVPHGYAKYSDFKEMTRGGKAVLSSCWDRIMGRTVALKKLLPRFADDSVERRRFLREARITAQLQHPNTVPVYEIGRVDSELYFTMKRLAGENLFKILQRLSWDDPTTTAKYPLDSLLEIITQVGLSLAYAHGHGVIHRDVKPENIWIGEYGEVVLLDWGVAKVWGNADGDEPSEELLEDERLLLTSDDPNLQALTQTGQRPGTPLYMSPEQVAGNAYLDERSDVFSLGVVIYEMLTFTEPFRGHDVRATFNNILHDRLPAPSTRSKRTDIPQSLDDAVLRAIEKKTGDRFQSMLDFVEALRQARRQID